MIFLSQHFYCNKFRAVYKMNITYFSQPEIRSLKFYEHYGTKKHACLKSF